MYHSLQQLEVARTMARETAQQASSMPASSTGRPRRFRLFPARAASTQRRSAGLRAASRLP
jgi:hypothetical protein